jgi:uncharacterized protein YceK
MMMKWITTGCLAACLLIVGSGCGTISYQRGNRGPGPLKVKSSGVYGGVKLDGKYLYACVAPENPVAPVFWAMAPFVIIDLPLSFVADTIILPYTIPKAMRQQETKTEPNHTSDGIRQPADGSPKPSM